MEIYNQLISNLPYNWVQFAFMRNALLAILILSPLVGLLGTVIVNNRMAFFADALGHSTLAGVAIGVLLGMRNLLGVMLCFSLVLALIISYFKAKTQTSSDTIISIVSSTTISLGIVLLSTGGGFSKYTSFLIGDLLSITEREIQLLAVVLAIVIAFWFFFLNQLFLTSLNTSLARSRDIRTYLLESSFAALIALVVTMSIQWVGLLIINSLLVLPAASARLISNNAIQYTLWSVIIALFSGICGLVLSFYWSTASSATIVLIAASIYIIIALFSAIRFRT